MNIKKLLALLLALVMLLSLTACGGKKTGEEEPKVVWQAFSEKATTEKTVLTADSGCTVTIAPVSYTKGYVETEVVFHNPTEETRYLELVGFAVNGVMLDFYLNVDAAPGQTTSDLLSVSQDELRVKGIFEIATVDLLFAVTNEDWSAKETLSCQLKSSAAAEYEADPAAYLNAVTSKDGQKELEYTVVGSLDERGDMGNGVYMESKVYIEASGEEYLLMEVVNESDEVRYVRIYAETVNEMYGNNAGESYIMFPGTRAIVAIDTVWAMPITMRQAFGMETVAQIDMFTEVYKCTKDGEILWDDAGEYRVVSYTVPDRSAAPDMSGKVVYEENGLKITAKKPVEQVNNEEITETWVYLIFENTSDVDLYIREDGAKEIYVDGGTDYVYFQEPYFLGMGDQLICYLSVDDMEGRYVILPLSAENYDDAANSWDFEVTLWY